VTEEGERLFDRISGARETMLIRLMFPGERRNIKSEKTEESPGFCLEFFVPEATV
jgi:hypothetical protein